MNRRWIPFTVAVLVAVAAVLSIARPWRLLDETAEKSKDAAVAPSALGADATAGMSSRAPTDPAMLAARGTSGARAAAAPADALPAPVDFASVDRDIDLHGTVVDGDGRVVAGASLVTVRYPFQRGSLLSHDRYNEAVEGARTRSAKDGSFAIRLRRGATVALRVAALGFAAVERPSCHAGERVEIVMRPGVALVVVATTPEGDPAAGAVFRLWSSGGVTSAIERTGTTGADGRLRLDDLPAGAAGFLDSEASRWGDIEWKDVSLPDAGETTVAIAFVGGRTITGRVTDAETGAPIEGARVGMNWTLHRAVVTDRDGRYSMAGWTGRGTREIHALADGFGRGQALVGAATVLDFALSKGDTVVGRLLARDATPVAGAVVAAVASTHRDGIQLTSNAEGTSGPDGRFSLAGLRRDMPHTVVVMAEGFGRTLVDFDPREGGPGVVDLGDVRVPLGRAVVGRVVHHDGTPVERQEVSIEGANADRGRARVGKPPIPDSWYGTREDTTTDAAGRFAFLDLAPGSYEVVVKPAGMPVERVAARVPEDVDPAPLEIPLPAGRPVHIVVVDENGKPVPWACVTIVDAAGRDTHARTLDTHGETTILLADSVTAVDVTTAFGDSGDDDRRFAGGFLREFPVDPKAMEVRCVLETGASLAGRVEGPDGKPVVSTAVEIESGNDVVATAYTVDGGRFDATVPRSGRFTVRLVGALWTMTGPAVDLGIAGEAKDVAPGDDVVIKAHATARTGRQPVLVLDPDGRPVAGIAVFATWAYDAGRSKDATTDASGRATLERLPDLRCDWKTAAPSADSDFLAGRGPSSVPSDGVVEVRLVRGLRARVRLVVPPDAASLPIVVDLTQGYQRRTAKPLPPGETALSLLLDPAYGTGGTASARAGPPDAPTFVARSSSVRFDGSEIVLTLEPVK